MRELQRVTNKYYLYKVGGAYMVECRIKGNPAVCRGSLEECEAFISRHPYGITRREAEAYQKEVRS